VTVIDRDTLPVDGRPRTGAPQGRHGHILLPSGLQPMVTLFPGSPTTCPPAAHTSST